MAFIPERVAVRILYFFIYQPSVLIANVRKGDRINVSSNFVSLFFYALHSEREVQLLENKFLYLYCLKNIH